LQRAKEKGHIADRDREVTQMSASRHIFCNCWVTAVNLMHTC
jgi:hypothetical protein